jgi:iron complex outermembrane receptor protein
MEATKRRLFGVMLALAGIAAENANAQENRKVLPTINVTSSRLDNGIVGASTTIITAEEIARSPSESLQEIITRTPGVQSWSTFGAVNGAGTVIDMRGFGAAAASNTLVLINGRRVTDIDLSGVDLSAIPRDSIDRIEITRGNAGAVLYGDGAVGGVINIITKTGVNLPPSVKAEGGFGSFRQREGNFSAFGSQGPFAGSIFANAIDSDGYRVNNALRQRNLVTDFRYAIDGGSLYGNIALDDQKLGLPGARRVTLTSSELDTDRAGAMTPTAFANKRGVNATMGMTRLIGDWLELIVDGGVRYKRQEAFSEISGFVSSDTRDLTTLSLTPRIVGHHDLFGRPSKVTAGLDFYDATLTVDRSTQLTDPPIHIYNLRQRSVAAYWMQTLGIAPTTDVSWGIRGQQTMLSARDRFDPSAPGAFIFDAEGTPLKSTDVQHALHFGIEHRFTQYFAVFGRVARSFRTPNVDERIGVASFPVDFNLRTQTSRDIEGGVRLRLGAFELLTSAYDMELDNEIHFNPSVFANVNLDPTRRYGTETSMSLRVNEALVLKGGFAYTRSMFREGIFAGNDVPLVSRWTGSAGFTWNIWQRYLMLDLVAKYVGPRRMDNDQANFQPMIPAHTLVDIRIGGEIKNAFWSVSVQNLLNENYFDYAVASTSTFGTYNAYPQPGATYMARLGVKFE